MQVAQLTAVTEYMVVLEGNSRPQNQAIAQNIEDKMMEVHNREPKTQVCAGAWGAAFVCLILRPFSSQRTHFFEDWPNASTM